jgi:hypothetical protein
VYLEGPLTCSARPLKAGPGRKIQKRGVPGKKGIPALSAERVFNLYRGLIQASWVLSLIPDDPDYRGRTRAIPPPWQGLRKSFHVNGDDRKNPGSSYLPPGVKLKTKLATPRRIADVRNEGARFCWILYVWWHFVVLCLRLKNSKIFKVSPAVYKGIQVDRNFFFFL